MKPQTRLKRIDPALMPDDIRAAWSSSMALRNDGTFFEVFAQHLPLYRWYINQFYGEVFYKGLVDQQFKELLRLRLSTLHGCRFCNQGNRKDALAAGLTSAQIASFEAPENGPFNDAEKAVLALADQLSLLNLAAEMDATLHERLQRHFTDAQILELGLIGGILAGVAKFLFTFDLVEKEDYCPFQSPQDNLNKQP